MKTVLLSTMILLSALSFAQTGSTYTETNSYDLEMKIVNNMKEGLPRYTNIYTKIVFEMEDFSLLQTHFDFLHEALNNEFTTAEFYLDTTDQRLIVLFEKSKGTTDDFLKIFKETMKLKQVYMYLYADATVIKQ
jgi:hypothetical protein